MMKMVLALLVLHIMVSCIAGNLEQRHDLMFGKVTHELPSELFMEPRTIANLQTPGITEDYRFEETEKGSAVIVITKIRPDYPKDDSLLDKIKPKNEGMKKHFGGDVVLLRTINVPIGLRKWFF